jgi:Flp pilus assembly protein TadG
VTPGKGERGSSLPETAIVMAVLLSVMFGIIDFGRALYTYGFVAQLAREGARYAVVRGSACDSTKVSACPAQSSDVQTYVRSLNEGATDASKITATLTWPSCPGSVVGVNNPGCVAKVTVHYPFAFIAPFVSKATIGMSSASQMVISQ